MVIVLDTALRIGFTGMCLVVVLAVALTGFIVSAVAILVLLAAVWWGMAWQGKQ